MDDHGAVGTLILMRARQAALRKGEGVAAGFVGEAEFDAGLAPFLAVRGDAAASGAVLGEKVRQFVTEGAVDLGFAELEQARI